MNPMLILQLKPAWEQFKGSHPKLLNFIKAASKDSFLDKGSLIEISVTNSAGKTIASNIRVKEDDLAFLSALKDVLEDTQI
ncbi:MAG: hypothetical protein E7244_14390 [Enterocloster citroniae]|nr:hypothetical protein [Enterocloster citroniae]